MIRFIASCRQFGSYMSAAVRDNAPILAAMMILITPFAAIGVYVAWAVSG